MSEKRSIFEARKAGNPIFTVEPPVGRSQEFEDIRQIWMDLQVSYSAILDSQRVTDLRWDISEAVGSALTDVMHWAQPLFARTTSPRRLWLDEEAAIYVGPDSTHLTTRSLYEAMALSDELITFPVSAISQDMPQSVLGFRDSLRNRYETLVETLYGVPHRMLATVLGTRDLPFPEAATTIACLADFALNPPLPPYVAYDNANRPKWSSIYPPIRFIRACQAVQSLGFLPHEPNDSDLRDFFEQVSLITELPNPNNYCDGVFFSQPISESEGFNFISNRIGELDGDHISFLAWAARKLWNLRISNPGILQLYGQLFFSQEDFPDRHNKVRLHVEDYGWFSPPIRRTDHGTLGHAGNVSDTVAGQYLISLAFYLNLHHLACRAGNFDLTKLPVPALAAPMRQAQQAINASMGLDVW